MTILRSRKPYTCRNLILGEICAQILSEFDADICQPCAAAVAKAKAAFLDAPIAKTGASTGETLDELISRRKGLAPFWPLLLLGAVLSLGACSHAGPFVTHIVSDGDGGINYQTCEATSDAITGLVRNTNCKMQNVKVCRPQ